jgi:hypothetical protein
VNERGYVGAHDASVIRRSQERAQPKGLAGLIRWFVDRWSAETSTELHARGVWVGRQQYGKDGPRWRPELVGGSLLGSPADGIALRAQIDGSAFRTEHASSDGRAEVTESYATPMRATITWMERHRHPLLAAWLRALGHHGGDWHQVTSAANLPEEYGEAITRDALTYAWKHFEETPLP